VLVLIHDVGGDLAGDDALEQGHGGALNREPARGQARVAVR
jgi:hypothetical protein